MYLSQDPIGLAGNNPTLYGYVKDVDSLRLRCKPKDIVGTDFKEVFPTQDYVNPDKVLEYRKMTQDKKVLPKIEAYRENG